MTTPQQTTQKAKRSPFSFLVWWSPDPVEVEKQVAGYSSFKFWQSARGISLLLCLFSVAVTLILSSSMGIPIANAVAEAVIWITLGLFMYRGFRWAFVLGMLLWTVEKGALVAQQVSTTGAGSPFVQLIWWAVYMNAFYMGFTIERSRRNPPPSAPAAP